TGEAISAREVANMLHDADEALVAGDLVRARSLYLDALGRAPRHGEIVRRILEIDARAPERTEAALATLAEARQADGEAHFGTTPGELLAKIGEADAAVASLERTGDTEPTPALGARAFEIAARITPDAEEASRWLDRALARAPCSTTARWMRVMRYLELGRLDEALADAEHLEALARGGDAKCLVWLRAGRAWHAVGQSARAGPLFERALRYAPDEPEALAGLGAALVVDGREARGVAVLTRAVELASPAAALPIALELARALAERLDDLPAAVARISAIPADAHEGAVARGLEGRWRARLGDLAGAALAFARLRELASSMAVASGSPPLCPTSGEAMDDGRTATIVALLVEGADLLRGRLGDARGAQRHLAAALRLRPHDAELRRAYREVGALVAGDGGGRYNSTPRQERAVFALSEIGPAVHPATVVSRLSTFDLAPAADDAPGTEEEARAAIRVEELTRQLQANPRDDATANELASLLGALGRSHELLALISARLEDATPEGRVLLAPQARAALARLATEAERAGRLEEASLYRTSMERMAGELDKSD
ncbi:MAG: hypothetical protein M3O46_11235, partial [Myxococcota bacterium]|nr:hypothetical protein [Myxococcota bacterium]